MLKGRDLLSIHELTVGEVEEILELAAELKAKQKAGIEHKLLAGKTLGMIFEKSSTRTRVSFETGMPCSSPTVTCSWAAASLSRIRQGCCLVIWTAS